MPKSAAETIAWFESHVGYHEGRNPDGSWNNREKFAAMQGHPEWSEQGWPWCDIFVGAGAKANGFTEDEWPTSPSCDFSMAKFKALGRLNDYPAVGAQVFYGVPGDSNHTGVVADWDDDTIEVIEGNTNDNGSREGDGVYRKVRLRRSAYVLRYGYPKYPEGLNSADPTYPKPAEPIREKHYPNPDTIIAAAKRGKRARPGKAQFFQHIIRIARRKLGGK